MNNFNIDNINEFSKRLLPITELRRNAGEILAELPKVGSFILTKDGKPVAEIIPIGKRGNAGLVKARGAWKETELEKKDFYKLILKWRKSGTRKKSLKI